MKVLYLTGWFGTGKLKTMALASRGCHVIVPKLSNWSFETALKQAQDAIDRHQPDLIVASSRGSAIALKCDSSCPQILFAPAIKFFRVKQITGTGKVNIIHGLQDGLTHPRYSDELKIKNPKQVTTTFLSGVTHQCNESKAILKMLQIVAKLQKKHGKFQPLKIAA